MRPDISIIIPVFNAQSTLNTSIKSIVNQNYKFLKPEIEIILVIDDKKKYEQTIKHYCKNIKIKVLKTKKYGSGPGIARNVGIIGSSGKYIGFLDADDSYSSRYIEEMYRMVKKENISIAPTHVFINKKKLNIYKGKKKNFLTVDDISNNPCSFHPMVKKNLINFFEEKASQDIYNLSILLNKKPIKIIEKGYYKLQINSNSYTSKKNFYHTINLAYKHYQIKSVKDKKIKIARQFAIRRIINKKYMIWKKINNKSYYEFLRGLKR